MTLKRKKKSLADKINSLVTTTPITFNSDIEDEDIKAKVIDHYDESDDTDGNFQISEIRKRTVDHLDQIDKRYKGKKISRKDVYNNNDDSNLQNTLESEDKRLGSMEKQSENDMIDSDDANNDESGYINDENDNYDSEINFTQFSESKIDKSDIEDENGNTFDAKQGKYFQTMSQTNAKDEIEKGNSVRSQLKLWESLLEIRIKLQKCLTTSNQMPQYDIYKDLKMDPQYMKAVDETKNKLKLLLNNILQLQYFLLKQYSETKKLCNTDCKKRKAEIVTNLEDSMNEKIPSDTEDEDEHDNTLSNEDTKNFNENIFKKKLKLDNYEKILNNSHKSYVDYRNSVIQKWNEKTRVASGKLNKGTSETTLKQIEFALNEKEKLRKRSRLKCSEYKIVGKIEATDNIEGRRIQEYDNEVYDDDDFYHQLLRDLIEYKSSDITDPIPLSKQWIQLQNMRSKIKRKIDTKATKGRKIRYNIHNKLVNFMAPIITNDAWTDHAKNDLYSSLFGKIKPTNGK
ncbi:PREDICTED: protein AATF [Habropoda laboriosa]|uniref:protein AATF n=1 Tax=Habropoda laboriosa TaxID=597456 RepID=UPI00083E3DC4|nr:PREDICTED: protein AATF [Habropoda laboriosa]